MNETDLTLVDYFAVIGLDKSSGLKPDPSLEFLAELSGNSGANERLPPLERSYEAKVLSHFPEKRRGFLFPQEIASLCMPKGLKFYTETKVPMDPQFHSFVIIREDGMRMNGCALTLYEEVRDESIRQAMYDLQMDHVKEIAAAESQSRAVFDSRTRQKPGTVSFGNHTMPRHISARRNNQKRTSYYDSTSKPIFVSKCIALLTRIPMVFTSEKILRSLADMIKPNFHSLPVPMESFIYWILHEVPLPVPGTTLQLNYSGIDLIVIRPSGIDLPFFDYPLQHVFNYISVEKFLKLFTCFLLEHQILLCSKYMERLMLVAESLANLVFPFRWQLTYVPILPYNQLKFIEAPVPYVMGLCYDDFIPDQIYQSNICILDIDNKKLDFPEDVPPFPKHRQLENDDGYETASQSPISEETQNYFQGLRLNQAVRDLMLNHFACLFYSYDSFLIGEGSTSRDSVVNFDKASFLSDQPDSFLPFLAAFLETQMFASFIDAKILSQFHSYDENIKVFDQKILQVRERLTAMKVQTPTIEKPADILLAEDSREVFCPLPISAIQMDYEVRQPRQLPGTSIRNYGGFFPEMDPRVFETNLEINSTHSPWKQQKQRQRTNSLFEESSLTPKNTPKKKSNEENKSREHWKFVEQLLKETKAKTKRMLVLKMGKEAVHLGHNDIGITGVEENTLVATFCDLLERVWAHGLKKKQGKSALWTHVLSHQEREKNPTSMKNIENSTNLTPEFLPVPKRAIEAFEKVEDPSQRDSTGSVTSAGLNELIESLRQLSKPLETEESTTDESLWSRSFLKAANFIADKLAQPEDIDQEGNNVKAKEPDFIAVDNGNYGEHSRTRRREPGGRPLPRSSSMTRFASWARNTIRDAASAVAGTNPRDMNGNQEIQKPQEKIDNESIRNQENEKSRTEMLPPPGNFAPHWSNESASSVPSSSASSAIGIPTGFNSGGSILSSPMKSRPRTTQDNKKRSLSRPRSPMEREKQLRPLPSHIAYDLKSVMEMSEIKTDIGCARAFVRLALERKLLHKHLKTIFSNEHLLQKLYRRYAFLRSEDEREQFLYHILSLNAVDFSCFTNTFIATKMQYEVLLVAGIDRFASASVWIMITGSLGNTSIINLPPNSLQFTFDILIRNNITGQTFRFNCGRWFGKGVDDGALERLLVAEVLPRETPEDEGPSTSSGSIFPLPLFFVLNLISGLGGTQKINLPMFTVLRRFSIFLTMVFEYFILRVTPPFSVKISVFLMIFGAFIAAIYDLAFDAYGYFLIMINDICTAANGVYVKKTLQDKDLGKWGLMYYNSLFMLGPLLVIATFSEDTVQVREFVAEGYFTSAVLLCFILSSICGFILNYSLVTCTHYNSALTTTCVGPIKNLFVTYVGMFSSGDYIFTWNNFIGVNISVIGSLLYTYVTFRTKAKPTSRLITVKPSEKKGLLASP
ncbi:hypothetical protein FO519_002563 [Halicephalobus sp. NKZ332]|nr:hypothetical protein FO519_002563 [Halicephalobus sp. NKZ332]